MRHVSPGRLAALPFLNTVIEGVTLEDQRYERKFLEPEIAAVAVRTADAANVAPLWHALYEYAETMTGRRERAPTAYRARPRRC